MIPVIPKELKMQNTTKRCLLLYNADQQQLFQNLLRNICDLPKVTIKGEPNYRQTYRNQKYRPFEKR